MRSDVGAGRALRVAQDGHVLAAEVPGEDEARLLAVLVDVEHRDGAAEHVARVEEREVHAGRDRQLAVVGHADHLVEDAKHVVAVVEGLDALHVDCRRGRSAC